MPPLLLVDDQSGQLLSIEKFGMRNFFVLASMCLVVAGCAGDKPTTASIPAYLSAQNGCAVVAGGSLGSDFTDPKVEGFWHDVNRQISSSLYEKLSADGFTAVPLTVARGDNATHVIAVAAARSRCNRVIQVEHTVSEDAQGKYFSYQVSLMRFSATGRAANGTQVVTVGEYQRSYRFPRTADTFRALTPVGFAGTVFADLKASGKLEPLRQP
ncbi:hypothetical protein [Ralstonia solanacearum]|uniref:hypothetical protein n=1 Tax=Ralstonia solanacearum TaxID=305 RepID=UPI0018CFFD6C|nr:hypothetical protein [Ralstonia solanacearum]